MAFLEKGTDQELSSAWMVTRTFCQRINSTAETGLRQPISAMLETMASVMYRLLRMHFDTSSYREATRLGLLAFSSNVFLHPRSLKLETHGIPALFRRCVSSFKIEDTSCASQNNFVIWLLMVGIVSGFVAAEDNWLNPLLRSRFAESKIGEWCELQHILGCFLWIEPLHDKRGRETWESFAATTSAEQGFG